MGSEVWQFSGIDGYWVSDRGEVEKRRTFERIAPYDGRTGVPYIDIISSSGGYKGPLWKLVVMAFYTGSHYNLEVQYADGDKWNCSLDNIVLLYTDPTGKKRPVGWQEDPYGRRRIDRRLKHKVQIVETGEVFSSAAECAEKIKGTKHGISKCLNGKLPRHMGFTFRYI